MGSLALELSPHWTRAVGGDKVARDQGWDTAEPHGGIRAPADMHRVGREHALVERSSDHGGKYVRLAQDISVLVRIQNLEQGVEVVRGLIDMEHANGAIRTNALPQIPDGNLHRNHRVLTLGRSVIRYNDGLPATIKLDVPNSFLQQGHRQRGTSSRQFCVFVISAFALHNALAWHCFLRHREVPAFSKRI